MSDKSSLSIFWYLALTTFEHFADELNMLLNFIFLLNKYESHFLLNNRQIHIKGCTHLYVCHYMWCLQEDFRIRECLIALGCPFELSLFFKVAKRWNCLSPTQERKWVGVAKCLVSCWTCLILNGNFILTIAWHLSKFASIPFMVSINLWNLLTCIPKEHLGWFKCMLHLMVDSRMSSKSIVWLSPIWIFQSHIIDVYF